jgi:hypothetical protein
MRACSYQPHPLLLSQSQSHVTTDDQSVSKSWFQDPSGSHDRILISVWHLLFYRCRAPPLTRGRSVICISHLNCFSSVILLLAFASYFIADCLRSAFFTSKRHKPSHHVKVAVHGAGLLLTKVKVTLRPTTSRSVRLGFEPRLGLMTRCYLLFDSYWFVDIGRPLWREVGSVICLSHLNCISSVQ